MWIYHRTPFLELGSSKKFLKRALRPHVHSQVQVMIVTKGSRHVQIGARTLIVSEKSVLIIPSGVAHVACERGWDGFNIYLNPSMFLNATARLLLFSSLPEGLNDLDRYAVNNDILNLLDFLSEGKTIWFDNELSAFIPERMASPNWPKSREGRIRKYQREAGISPHGHFNAIRLDKARQMIASGMPIASVASELDFSDQSHLGRRFLALFGTSPGRYARGSV